MAKIDISDTKALRAATDAYIGGYPGKLICALQFWYEGLGGQGVPTPEEMSAVNAALAATPGWADAGSVRYEKFGAQQSYTRT
ncbi:MAG: hypothetical protein LBH28_10100 [Oscillospiraceae bacterium]|jgi:hypothetical protein|nr:hypothetical protein [Oscillospiraceae bacterium]